MGTIKAVILSACVVGIVTVIANISVPDGAMKKQMNTLLGMILIIVIALPFINSNISVTKLKSYDAENTSEYSNFSEKIDGYFSDEAQKKIEEYFENKLNKNGIVNTNINVKCKTDSYGNIVLKKITVSLHDLSYKDKIKSLISEEVKNADIEFTTEVSSEAG